MTRFRVTSISGWTIRPSTSPGASSMKMAAPSWQVLDSAVCFQVVREFRASHNQHRKGDPEGDAYAFAAMLEAKYP